LDAGYWRSNLESPVLFSTAVQNLINQQKSQALIFLEIGPHSTLSASLRQIFAAHSVKNSYYVPTVLKQANEAHSIMKAVGEIFCQGFPVNFANVYRYGKLLTDLPVYPWDRQSNDWKESRISYNWRFRKHPVHELLGARMPETSDLEPGWRNLLSMRNVPWLADHKVLGECIFPCAGYIAMVNEALRQLFDTQECTIRNLHVKAPLVLPSADGTMIEVVTSMRPVRISDRLDSKWYEFSISSHDGGGWTKHVTGKALASPENLGSAALNPPSYERAVSSPIWYKMLANLGLEYGPQFQGLESITASVVRYEASATIRGHIPQTGSSHALHPISIDQCLQLFSVAATHGRSPLLTKLYIPLYIEEVCLGQSKDLMKARASGGTVVGSSGQGSVELVSGESPVLVMRGVTLVPLDMQRGNETSKIPLSSHEEWRPDLDLLPSYLQLPLSQDSEDTVELLFKAIGISLMLLHRKLPNLAPSSYKLQHYKAWLQSQRKILDARGILSAAKEEPWAQICSESLEQQLNVLGEKLKAKGLGFIVELTELTVQEITAAFEKSPCASISMARSNALRKFNEWVPSLSSLANWLSLLGHSNPNLRILEVGGQKGSLSLFVLQNLASDENNLYSRYTWTEKFDIENTVKQRLQGNNQIDFRLFNVDKEPSVQELEEGGYDLIIVSNVSGVFS
jgi:acyl transferase domain-containing protein